MYFRINQEVKIREPFYARPYFHNFNLPICIILLSEMRNLEGWVTSDNLMHQTKCDSYLSYLFQLLNISTTSIAFVSLCLYNFAPYQEG
jgi:hypothetical protein